MVVPVVLVFTQVWGYAKVWVLGRFWLRLGPRFGGAADPGFTPRSRGFGATLKTPPRAHIFHLFSPPLSRPLAIEPPALELQRGELAVVVGERGVEVRIVHRRTVVDDHEVDEAGRGEKRLVNRDLSQAVGPSQVLHGVPRPGRSAESGFNPECQVWEIRDLSKDLIHGTVAVRK